MALYSSSTRTRTTTTHLPSSSKTHLTTHPFVSLKPKNPIFLGSIKGSENGSGVAIVEKPPEKGAPVEMEVKFEDVKWVSWTWDLNQFQKNGATDWDAVIDAEVKRRKWLKDNPESSNNDFPVVFDTSIIPWWACMKRFHLPEAERLNGRAAMIGFFMAYFVDSLTGVGLVDQMGNFFCKTLLFVAVGSSWCIVYSEERGFG